MEDVRDYLTKDERDAFLNKDSDRAKAIVLASIAENHLTSLIKYAFRKDEKIWNELFQPAGSLGDFGVKIRMAYMAGYIDKSLYGDLLVVSKIRNQFAHYLSVTSFTNQKVQAWIKNMHSYKIIVDIANRRPIAKNKPARVFLREISRLKKKALRSMTATYTECLGHILHELIVNSEEKHRIVGLTGSAPQPLPEKS